MLYDEILDAVTLFNGIWVDWGRGGAVTEWAATKGLTAVRLEQVRELRPLRDNP